VIKAPIDLQDLRRRLYDKAKAEPAWRFWGLYVHVCKLDTLREAYALAKKNNGAPGIDGVSFEVIEAGGVEAFLGQLRDELLARTRAAQRHRLQQQGEKPIFRAGDLAVDLVRRIVTVRGVEVKFSPREYDLLRLLVMHAGKVLTHNMILREVWGPNTDVQYLRIYIRALRQKIESDMEKPEYIMTETGVGYRLRAPDA